MCHDRHDQQVPATRKEKRLRGSKPSKAKQILFFRLSLHSVFFFKIKFPGCFRPSVSPGNPRQSRLAMASVQELVDSIIKEHPVAIFSKSYCPFCKMAKEAFQKINVNYYALELDKRDDGDAIQDVLGQLTGGRSVPRVFVHGTVIGGGTDVKKLQESGELSTLVQK
ncbi:hypothetical protein V9T40_006844 [Parthenolecanium corni]|uniref:Glutaredoxin-2, mitochondrial n=1 Tax=Parthenolecanium corni TaxID=536013 RepID=A0AAN9Y9Y0_9HEMI